MPTQTIHMVFQGLIALFVSEDRTQCTVGVLKDPPPTHRLDIKVQKSVGGGPLEDIPFTLRDELNLDVRNTTKTTIEFVDVQPHLDRTNPNQHTASFSWAVDLENRELYGRPIGAIKAGFKPILTFNVGELSTEMISHNQLEIKRGAAADFVEFGFVAVQIGVLISLDRADSQAVFTSGRTEVFTSEPNTDYEITITNETTQHESTVVEDANHYYKAVGLGLSHQEKILFRSIPPAHAQKEESEPYKQSTPSDDIVPAPPAAPEAACFTAHLGQSQPTEP